MQAGMRNRCAVHLQHMPMQRDAQQGRAAQTSFFRADSAHEPAAFKIEIRSL
jgi:hypothetical protein